ncbi:MAG: hypothetical protein SFY66_28590 [Oculatellaceae cyanobacterium bins.114]|nr:hypothetical protein [Oculatellaceae cyanobacterium bins.114]
MARNPDQKTDRPSLGLTWTRLSRAALISSLSLIPLSQVFAAPLPTALTTAISQTTPQLNRSQLSQAQLKQSTSDVLPIPLAIVQPNGSTITIQVINATGAELNYQVIGDTQFRVLGAQSQATLQDLSIPTTVTFRRNDGGLVTATIETSSAAGELTLILQQTSDFTADRTALRVEPNGSVYLN